MEIDEFVKQQGEFLKADFVIKNPDTLFEIIGESKVERNERFNNDRLIIPVKAGDKEFTFDCSKTNARIIVEALGKIATEWIGHHLSLDTYRTKTSEGKMTDTLNIKEVK